MILTPHKLALLRPSPARPRRGIEAGFTLVELLVGMALSAAVLLAVLSSYTYLARNIARLANQQVVESEIRRTLGFFTQDVRKANSLADTANLSASRVSLVVPSTTGATNTITYYYNNSSSATTATINGSSVSMAANSLTRCVYNGSSVTSLTLLNNISSGGLTLSYYDASNTAYTAYVDYLNGIKQVALDVSIQSGYAQSGSLTKVISFSTGRLVFRNRTFPQ